MKAIKKVAASRSGGDIAKGRVAPWLARHPRTSYVFLILSALVFIAYANSLGNGFVFDDNLVISHARQLSNFRAIAASLDRTSRPAGSLSTDQQIFHRPIRTIVMAIEYHFFGENPAGYRVVSNLFHTVNGVLVLILLRALGAGPWPPILAAVLFVLHPVQTESVAYVAGQRDILFTLFYLLGFLAYVRYRATARTSYLGLAGVAYTLSILTKEMAVTLPAVCIVYDLFRSLPGKGTAVTSPIGKSLRTGIQAIFDKSKWLYLAMGIVSALVLFFFVVVANPSHQRTLYGGGLWPTLMTSARIMVHYAKQMTFPLTLNADSYGAFAVSRSMTDPRGLVAFLGLAGIWYGLFRLLRADRWSVFGGVWFFLTLLPVSQIVPHQELVAEHFLYLPSVGFCLMVSLLVERALATRAAPAVVGLVSVVLVLLGIRTVLRNRDWKDELTLWTKAVQVAPHSYWGHQRLGDAHKALGRYEEAIREYETVQALTPGYATEYIAIGDSRRRLGQYEEAAVQFKQALAISPGSVAARLGLTHMYLAMGLLERARETHDPIAPFVSKAAEEFRESGDAKMAEGRAAEAVHAYRNGLEFNPFDPRLYGALGRAYNAMGRHEEAATAYQKARQLDPTLAPPQSRLGELKEAAAPIPAPPR
ncbi:MAG: tetratricopeptide repeat protein [Candidatus Methylomirabilaceae bacterium]